MPDLNKNPGGLSDERFQAIIDFIKWFIVSVVLVVMTTIIDAGFKDRQVGIAEIQEFGSYVELVTDNNRIAERLLLAQYFATVTPSDKLRRGWERYYELVKEEYDAQLVALDSLQEALTVLESQKSVSEADEIEILYLRDAIARTKDELTKTFDRPSDVLKSASQGIKSGIDGIKEKIEDATTH